MSIHSRIKRLEKLTTFKSIDPAELRIREGYFSDWNEDDLRAIVYRSEGEPFPVHIETRLKRDGML